MDNGILSATWWGYLALHPEVFKIMPTPCIVLASDPPLFTITDVNGAMESLAGCKENELTGKGICEVLSERTGVDKNECKQWIEKAILEGLPMKLPLLKYNKKWNDNEVTADYVYLQATVVPLLDSAGCVSKLFFPLTDVTEIKRNELSENNIAAGRDTRLLEETQRVARIGSWETSLSDKTIVWSDMTRKIFEVGDDFDPPFDNFRIFFKVESDYDTFIDLVQEAIESGQLFDTEIRITTAQGNERWIRITGQAEYHNGRCSRIYGAVQDITEKKTTEYLLTESRNKLQSLIESVNGIVWEATASEFEFSFVSDNVKSILGYTPEEWLGERHFWESHIHPDDLEKAVSYCERQVSLLKDHIFDYRMIKADGSIIWIKDIVSVIIEDGQPACLRGLMVDITETKIIEELNVLERAVLKQSATNDTSLNEVVSMYLRGIETIFPAMQCSMHKIKENCLDLAVAPSISPVYLQALYNLPIGPMAGSCGTAAYLKERVIVTDIANDKRWMDHAALALEYNLRACWSQPIINSEGFVLATLGFYYNKVRSPLESELMVIERTSSILKVILENRHKSILLEETTLLMQQGQELAGFGNWQWDISNNLVKWSEVLYDIYGLDKNSFKATFEGYQELLHPNDRERVKEGILQVLRDKRDIVFEERIVRPDGEIRHLKSWGRLQSDENGNPVKMLGACLDITESKKNQELLMASESRLRNILNAQTNYVIRIDLDGNYTYYNNKYREDFEWIFGGKELYGNSPMATIIPAHQHRVEETFMKSVQNPNQVFQVELDKISPSGGVQSTFWHFICLTNINGEPYEVQCIGLDITAKKKAENALKRSNERYKYVSKATEDAIFDWNSETGHIRWGEGFTRLFGLENNEKKNHTLESWKNRIHPSDREIVLESLSKTVNDIGKDRWQSSYQFRKKNGVYAYVQENGYILRNAGGEIVRMIGVLRDVTKQKQEEHHLKLLESVITHAHDLVIIAQADPMIKTSLSILYTNEAFARITGYELSDVVGENLLLFTGLDPGGTEEEKWIQTIKNGLAVQMETSLKKKNGTQVWISLSVNPVEDEKGHITHWVSIGRDISESRRYTRAIEQQNEKLKNIAFMQSHVVRAPLARLMAAVDLIKNYHNSELEHKQFLDYILSSANELDGIIREISEKARESRSAG
ncbi:PAS domain-containing protein [Dyadobacter sp. 32]|uniref:PAS domain-containing protein n=1 Tax=Dyadobacter sp. 32 TaxID=538966 RepID=UPI0011EE8B4A